MRDLEQEIVDEFVNREAFETGKRAVELTVREMLARMRRYGLSDIALRQSLIPLPMPEHVRACEHTFARDVPGAAAQCTKCRVWEPELKHYAQ